MKANFVPLFLFITGRFAIIEAIFSVSLEAKAENFIDSFYERV